MVAERRGAALQQIAAAQQKEGVFGWPEGVPEAGECWVCLLSRHATAGNGLRGCMDCLCRCLHRCPPHAATPPTHRAALYHRCSRISPRFPDGRHPACWPTKCLVFNTDARPASLSHDPLPFPFSQAAPACSSTTRPLARCAGPHLPSLCTSDTTAGGSRCAWGNPGCCVVTRRAHLQLRSILGQLLRQRMRCGLGRCCLAAEPPPVLPTHALQDKRVIAMQPLSDAQVQRFRLPAGQWVAAEVRMSLRAVARVLAYQRLRDMWRFGLFMPQPLHSAPCGTANGQISAAIPPGSCPPGPPPLLQLV